MAPLDALFNAWEVSKSTSRFSLTLLIRKSAMQHISGPMSGAKFKCCHSCGSVTGRPSLSNGT
eukprot:3603319-Pyramimonas_sp.AAC.1